MNEILTHQENCACASCAAKNSSTVLYNGNTFSCYTFSEDATINDVFTAFGNDLCSLMTDVATLQAASTAQLYTDDILITGGNNVLLTTILTSLQTQIDAIETGGAVDVPETLEDITVGQDIVDKWAALDCFNSYPLTISTTASEMLISVMTQMCECCDELGGFQLQIDEIWHEVIGNDGSGVLAGGDVTVPATGLNVTISNLLATYSKYTVEGHYVQIGDTIVQLDASSDNYIEVTSVGTYLNVAVGNGDPVPPIVTGNRILKAVTNGTRVTSTTDLRTIQFLDASYWSDDIVATAHIIDGAVTTAKLATLWAGGTFGDPLFIEAVINNKGLVTDYTSNINLTGLASGDVLKYDGVEWVVEPFGTSTIPVGATYNTLYYNAGWQASTDILSTGALLSIGADIDAPLYSLHLGKDATFGIALKPATPTGVVSVGGALTASTTYYYVAAFVDSQGNVSSLTTEISKTTTVPNKTITLTFAPPAGTNIIRVWRGTVSGTFAGGYFTLTENNILVDNGGLSTTAGAVPTSNAALAIRATSSGLSIGNDLDADNAFSVYSFDPSKTEIVSLIGHTYEPGVEAVTTYIEASGVNTGFDNIALKLSASGCLSGGESFGIVSDEKIMIGVAADSRPKAIMQIDSTARGFLPPRMSTAQRNAIAGLGADDDGMIIYNVTTRTLNAFNGDTLAWMACTFA